MSASHFARRALGTVVCGLALAFGASAQTTSPSTGMGTKSSASSQKANPDSGFARKAAMDGLAEVELGNMAQQKAANEQVKQFGARMVQDHTKANDELKQLASSKGIDLPTALDSKHKKDMDKLGTLSGAKFDKAYMSHMVDDHKKAVSEFKKQAKSGKDADLKAFASKTLPTLEEHLKMAQSTNDAVKKSK
jgi:putative membrane protein